jgi:hypothetical protein
MMAERLSPRWLFLTPWALLVPCGLLLSSCSNGLNSVQGKVLYKGNPIKGAVVFFHPVKATDLTAKHPSGVTGEDGSFTLDTGKENGAPTGQYVVTVVWYKEVPPSTKITNAPPPESEDQLKGRFADPKSSQLTVEIKPGVNQLEPFKLE